VHDARVGRPAADLAAAVVAAGADPPADGPAPAGADPRSPGSTG
jgi:hypothetical protein